MRRAAGSWRDIAGPRHCGPICGMRPKADRACADPGYSRAAPAREDAAPRSSSARRCSELPRSSPFLRGGGGVRFAVAVPIDGVLAPLEEAEEEKLAEPTIAPAELAGLPKFFRGDLETVGMIVVERRQEGRAGERLGEFPFCPLIGV